MPLNWDVNVIIILMCGVSYNVDIPIKFFDMLSRLGNLSNEKRTYIFLKFNNIFI